MRVLSLLFLLAVPSAPLLADTFDVTRGDDPPPDGCLPADCSLREAVDAAQATPGADVVRLGAGQHFLTRGDLVAFGELVIEGTGRDTTEIVGSGGPTALRIAAQSSVTVRRLRFAAAGGTAIAADRDHTVTTLDAVDVPGGEVVAGDSGAAGHVALRVRDSSIGGIAACIAAEGTCELVGSQASGFGVMGEQVAVRVTRSELTGPDFGVLAWGAGEAVIEDSTIRGAARPLDLWQAVAGTAADVVVRRTRFIGNTGPLRGNRDAMVWMEDVEFRDNVVAGDSLANGDPAVLLADEAAAWRIQRALFVGNRGGAALDGAVVRVLAGANVVMSQVTFADNTFHEDAGGGYGDTIGVYAADTAIFWLFHATMRKAPSLPAGTPGSLLTVRGGPANVRVYNSVLDGRCAFGGGGAVFQAEGNIEAGADSCGFDPASNEVAVPPIQLHLGALADHGGFTDTFDPAVGSIVLDRAKDTWCRFYPLDQRGHVRPADGVGCDVGAVEKDALPDRIFADGFGF